MAKQLKSCPCCGTMPILVDYITTNDEKRWKIVCSKCLVSTRSSKNWTRIIKHWNRRV